jgi:hypothetical protein
MKCYCKFCQNTCKKIGHIDCDKYTPFSYEDAKKEMRALNVSKSNPERLEYLRKRIANINGGTY